MTGLGVGPVALAQTPSWDNGKVRMCVCDAGYTGVDCARRMCPRGNDVLDDRDNAARALRYQVQNLTLVAAGALGDGHCFDHPSTSYPAFYNCFGDLMGKTFALTFTSRLNQSYTTKPLVVNALSLADDIRAALRELPNYVVDDCAVSCEFVYLAGYAADAPTPACRGRA